ncbi:acyl carrier protein [Marchantia polymorpha subsp. ruderalis]|uniref:Carrier domain-containing protein n=2 Tax=Marchantia polymorpha TaxID=3197 RepID=A0AAF6B6S4_MARPO|nr:hypothetical protein MARPO_0087s0008 [Marchantia polymorpha]BBN07708.1 hypothetical protein Mp_4g05830 [Marchantia polymorpha subsp. ruderalis]|eukprot:PTQ33564.1 hypothetical protein MARPO_0087s0008 [Marchantia polymorpha]
MASCAVGGASGASGVRPKAPWRRNLKFAMLLITILLLLMSIVHVLVQPSVYFHEKVGSHHLPHLAAYGGVKAFIVCPQETKLHSHEHGGRSSETFNTLSARCAALSRTLQTSKNIINKILLVNTEHIDVGTKFADIGDSLDKIEILTALQTQFNVTLSEDIVPKISTVGEVVALIEQLRYNKISRANT